MCGAAWRRRRERRRRDRTGAEAGRMLRCVWMRLSTAQMRRAGGTWRRRVGTGVAQEVWLRVRVRVRAAERGRKPRMLRCVWQRLSTTQVRRRWHVEAWRRDRSGAGSVVRGRRQRGGGSQARGSLSDLCVFVGCSEFWQRGPSPSWDAVTSLRVRP